MSKITMNATTFDLMSALTLDEIKLLEKMNPDALCLKDKDGNTEFKVMSSPNPGVSQYGIAFRDKDRNGNAVMTFPFDTNAADDELFNALFDKVGKPKAMLDKIEIQALAVVESEKIHKAEFIADLTGETQAEPNAAEG